MRASTAVLVLVLAHLLVGCDNPSALLPTASTFTPPPAAPSVIWGPVDGERWNLTGTYIGHTGPEACLPPFDGKPREPGHSVLVIQRSGRSIGFWTEHDHYVGALIDNEFLATERDEAGSTWQCGEKRLHFLYEGQVSGRFSEDGRTLMGEEVAVFRLESGETIRRRWSWSATQQ